MPVHLNGVLMSGGFRGGGGGGGGGGVGGGEGVGYRTGLSPGLRHRTASLEMLNNIKFEEKRALIASTLSLNDLLKPDYRTAHHHQQQQHTGHMATTVVGHHVQFSPVGGAGGGGGGGYMLPSSLYKTNSTVNGYNNVNFLNNGIAEKDLGKTK